MAKVEERRIGGRERAVPRAGCFGGDTVSQADGAARAVVVPRSQSAGGCGGRLIDRNGGFEAELSEIERGVFFVSPGHPYQVVEHLGDAKCCQGGAAGPDETLNLPRSRLTLEEG